jgi:hypothetical protein
MNKTELNLTPYTMYMDNTDTNTESQVQESEVSVDQCVELKNIKYKTMLLNGNPMKETKSSENLSNLDKFLEDEKNVNRNEPWCKLNKTIKTKKLIDFVDIYKQTAELDEEEQALLIVFFKDSLERKKLQRVKDVVYDKTNGQIKEIPALTYIKANKHFTLKNMDKRVSTLKSLAPKKSHHGSSLRNKVKDVVNENKAL